MASEGSKHPGIVLKGKNAKPWGYLNWNFRNWAIPWDAFESYCLLGHRLTHMDWLSITHVKKINWLTKLAKKTAEKAENALLAMRYLLS